MVVTFPPDAVFGSEGFDFERAGAEHAVLSPGLAETFEPDNPGMHRTPTVDYVAVLSGRVVLELDDGATVALGPGDTVVQQGTRHAWRNPFDEPVSIAVVLTGAHGG
ncbi:cupin domain-containing protein [uncultured Maritimibacter sp.]|jgi:mannose-6-phosphate isomerase-like protein (cupin superfamily)|uniref:cupin domain-containing protein n=1 Tax=uncultured Maritimibacter sp. TaxID=991866 RepID=UPI0026228BB0|nr:cupin domain-containing protein [uncultured Maritimibacter sp.]